MSTDFTIAGLGGTFDHFHQGHQGFINFAADLADYLIIGITNDEMVQAKQYPELVQPHFERVKQVKRFCEDNHFAFELVELDDPYGPTIEPDTRIQTLVVTEETEPGADEINQLRREKNLKELPVQVYSMVEDERGQPIHSENIRAGEISRDGVYYAGILENGLDLSDNQRRFFAKLQGKLVKKPEFYAERACVVGDFTLEKFLSFNWQYDLAVYDNQTERGAYNSPLIAEIEPDHTLKNPSGKITPQLLTLLQNWQRGDFQHLLVEGEEDLATVVLVLTLPLESAIYYGQPDRGLVELKVTEKVKNRFYKALAE